MPRESSCGSCSSTSSGLPWLTSRHRRAGVVAARSWLKDLKFRPTLNFQGAVLRACNGNGSCLSQLSRVEPEPHIIIYKYIGYFSLSIDLHLGLWPWHGCAGTRAPPPRSSGLRHWALPASPPANAPPRSPGSTPRSPARHRPCRPAGPRPPRNAWKRAVSIGLSGHVILFHRPPLLLYSSRPSPAGAPATRARWPRSGPGTS